MDEEEVGGNRRQRRATPAGRPSGGLSLAAKTALITGGVTLAMMALALFAASAGSGSAEQAMDEAGYAAAQALAGTDPQWWVGPEAAESDDDADEDAWKPVRKHFIGLFGEKGKEWWDQRRDFISTKFSETEDWEESDTEDLKEAKRLWIEGIDKIGSGSGGSPKANSADKALQDMCTQLRVVERPAYKLVGAWISEPGSGAQGTVVASYPKPSQIACEWEEWSPHTQKMAGQITRSGESWPVTVYTGSMGRGVGGKPLRAYVALYEDRPAGSSQSTGLGIILAVIAPLVVGGIAWTIAGQHTKNVRNLAREIDRLGSSGDATRLLRTQGGEAAFVARAVERMIGNLEFRSKHGDADLGEIADKEKKVAEEIHGALMGKNPPRLRNWEVETLYKPGFEIAGDHFEYFPIDDQHLGVILLDTNVRGLPAALVMASARSYVRAAAPGQVSPAAVLKKVNRHLAGDLPPGRHVTALYVVIDTAEGKATISSAGHLPLLVYRHATGKVAKVNPEGIALGLDSGAVFDKSLQEGDIPINVGDRIVLYTDGALNISDEYGEEFGETRFYEAVTREAPKNSQAFVNFVGSAIDQYHLNTPQNDDVTISTVKRLP